MIDGDGHVSALEGLLVLVTHLNIDWIYYSAYTTDSFHQAREKAGSYRKECGQTKEVWGQVGLRPGQGAFDRNTQLSPQPTLSLPYSSHMFCYIQNSDRKPRMDSSYDPTTETQDDPAPQIAIFDQDYWNDQRQNHPSEKTLMDVSNQTQDPMAAQLDREITNTRQNFYRPEKEALSKIPALSAVDLANPHFILKEGMLQKKTDGFFFPWHERYMVLTSEKLFSFQDEKKERAIGCVNLRLLPATLRKEEGGLLLDFGGECQNLLLRACSLSEECQWRAVLSQVLAFHSKENKIMLKTMNKLTYDSKDTLTEREFLKSAETGDVLLFYTQNFGAKVQRFFTNSDFDHVAMVVRLKKKDLMVFECNQMHGVSIYDWKQYITYFDLYGKVTFRKLNYIRKAEAQATLLAFMKKNLGRKYDLGAMKLLKMESDFNWENIKEDKERGYFCSELVAKALKSVGLLDERKASGRYWPVDFAQKSHLRLKKGATLGPEQTVVLNKHTKNQL